MADTRRIAFIGNALPRRCGIATFTTDLREAIAGAASHPKTVIVAMNDHGGPYAYDETVARTIDDDRVDDYIRAAEWLNDGQFDAVSLQHEYGIFGGEAGGFLLELLARLTVPVVTTLHTVLAAPSPAQRRVMDAIIAQSSRLVVMAEKGREMLIAVHGVAPEKIEVIAHGIPDFAFVEPDAAKAKLGLSGRPIVLTFGLLAPNKGIETVIDAMPTILSAEPEALYIVLGATHPNLVRAEGEAYRDRLRARAAYLGVTDNIRFVDGFVDHPTLLDYISACDVYVTPYLNEAQMTSGTLSYSFGLGKPVVSTPYWHAAELLGDGDGVLVPFGDSAAIGSAIAGLLADDAYRLRMRERAYAKSRSMIWSTVAERYVALFEAARRRAALRVVARPDADVRARALRSVPQVSLDYFALMCDDTGLFQHAVHSVPDRSHGYCVDDNARALILACQLGVDGATAMPEALTTRFASFIQHAWNPDNRWFRNFMGFDRRWLEARGSDDSHARTLWALGVAAESDTCPSRRLWAAELFAAALPTIEASTSPRSWAFTLIGIDAYLRAVGTDAAATAMTQRLGKRLLDLFVANATPEWDWFEDGLAYDNARLPQALLIAGHLNSDAAQTMAALRALDWLVDLQTAAAGHFRPVGSESFGDKRVPPRPFDQQPLEATATVSACLAASRVTGDARWKTEAERAFDWFLGRNDLGVALVDIDSGSCRDGLHRDRANENRGAESVLAWLMSACEMRATMQFGEIRPKVASLVA